MIRPAVPTAAARHKPALGPDDDPEEPGASERGPRRPPGRSRSRTAALVLLALAANAVALQLFPCETPPHPLDLLHTAHVLLHFGVQQGASLALAGRRCLPDDRRAHLQAPGAQRPLSIGIVSLFLDTGPRYSRYMEETVRANREAYARLHGYTYHHMGIEVYDRSRPAPWSKYKAVRSVLAQHDWVFYVDFDALFVNHSIPIERLLDDRADFILTNDLGGLNAGVWAIRNCDWSFNFLDTHYAMTEFITPPGASTLSGEQPAMSHLIASDASVRARVSFIPQCAMNSYPLLLRAEGTYVPGDFILHFAGGQNKTHALRNFVRTGHVDYIVWKIPFF